MQRQENSTSKIAIKLIMAVTNTIRSINTADNIFTPSNPSWPERLTPARLEGIIHPAVNQCQ